MLADGPAHPHVDGTATAPLSHASNCSNVNVLASRVLTFLPACSLADSVHAELDSTNLEEHYISPEGDEDVDRFVDEATWSKFFRHFEAQRAGGKDGRGGIDAYWCQLHSACTPARQG